MTRGVKRARTAAIIKREQWKKQATEVLAWEVRAAGKLAAAYTGRRKPTRSVRAGGPYGRGLATWDGCTCVMYILLHSVVMRDAGSPRCVINDCENHKKNFDRPQTAASHRKSGDAH